jgi:protein disulfide-isomerase A6
MDLFHHEMITTKEKLPEGIVVSVEAETESEAEVKPEAEAEVEPR